MDPLLAALALAALLVGATGTWSPCGFSMIETIGPTGHTGGRRTTLAACATFAPFAVLGGAITFVLLAVAGGLVGAAGSVPAYAIGAAVAIGAAALEARGVPIVPQVRRQLPVRWRASMPMPLAAAGYGVLLGLGFTTFVLSYGVWALMGVALVLGDPLAGAVMGVAFGVGRAVPIVVLAPLAERRAGVRACEAMAMRPGLYRGARLGDAAALALAGVLLAGSASAEAARDEAPRASDPSAVGGALAYELNGGRGILRRADGEEIALPGTDPAVGGPWAAAAAGGTVRILDRRTLERRGAIRARGADAIAVTRKWVAYRQSRKGRDKVKVASLSKGGVPRDPRVLAKARRPAQLSRPDVNNNLLVLAVAKKRRNNLVRFRLRGRRAKKRVLISTKSAAIAGPSTLGRRIAYVRTTPKRQVVRLKGLGKGKGRAVYRRRTGPPTLWTTALSSKRVYVTVVRRGGGSKLISVSR